MKIAQGTRLKPPTVLVLGSNPFEKKSLKGDNSEKYEIINLKYLPSLCQIDSLKPDLVIVNLQGQKKESFEHLVSLCKEIRNEHGAILPLVCISSETQRKQIANLEFDKLWNTNVTSNQIFDEVGDLIANSIQQKELFKALNELEDFKNSVNREMEQASIFQGALFNQAIARTNLKSAYHYLFQKEIGGDFFRIFELSASHVGILIGDVRGRGAGAALLTGFILGELYAISSEKQRILWSPAQLLARLSESIYSHNKMSELCSTAWYGVVDLVNGTIEYARAGHSMPLCICPGDQEARSIEGGSGFPLGIFPGMTYRNHRIKLPFNSRILVYTDGLINQKDTSNVALNPNWLQECFSESYKKGKPVRDIPAILDATFTDLSQGADPNDDRVILCCEISQVNQAYVRVVPKVETKDGLLGQIQPDNIALTIDQILSCLPQDLDPETVSEFELALEELMNKGSSQVQKARLIASSQEQDCQAEGFTLSWWIHQDRLDLSLSLDKCSIPWSYVSDPKGRDCDKIEGASSLIFFYDNLQVSSDGLEISMSKAFY